MALANAMTYHRRVESPARHMAEKHQATASSVAPTSLTTASTASKTMASTPARGIFSLIISRDCERQ